MNIYLIKLEYQGYNCYEGFVIAANDMKEAKRLAQLHIDSAENDKDCLVDEVEQFIVIGKASDNIINPKVLLSDYTSA